MDIASASGVDSWGSSMSGFADKWRYGVPE
jgi:hypothetical protein